MPISKHIKRNILLNPGPLTTTDAVKEALLVPDICPREESFCEVIEDVRRDLVRVAHGEKHYVAVPFGAAGTGAIEACISSVASNGKKILIVNNGSYGDRMLQIARLYYRPESVIDYAMSHTVLPEIRKIERILKTEKDISHIAVVHHETTTGMLNPIRDILRVSERYGVQVIVDAMSSFGGIPIDLENEAYDYVISSANKCLQGLPGISFVICKRMSLEELKALPRRSFYLSLWHQYDCLAQTRQMAFTPPVQVLYALRQALKEFFEETQARRYERYADSWTVLKDGLEALGLKMLLPERVQSKLLTAVLEPSDLGYSFTAMHHYLFERGITIYPGKGECQNTFRIANMGDINREDIRLFLKELGAYLNHVRIPVS